MKKLLNSLFEAEHNTLTEKFKNLFTMLLINLIWVVAVLQAYEFLLPEQGIRFVQERDTLQVVFWSMISAPLWEELVFRYLPRKLGDQFPKLMLPLILCSSIMFGYIHNGVPSIWIQGFIGLSFFWLYMKNGSIYWTMVAHALWNYIVIFGLQYLR